MKHLILLVGPPGSGKSSLAEKYMNENYYRVSQDDQGKEGHLERFKTAMSNEFPIIIDRLNFNKVQRERYLKPAKEAGYTTKIIVLHVPKQVCLERCNARLGHPTIKDAKSASQAVNMFFSKYERVEDSEADEVVRDYGDPEKTEAVIFDLDGTLCDISERLHFVKDKDTDSEETQKKDWKQFFKNIPNDKPNKWCVELIEAMLHSNYLIILVSGRPDDYKQVTMDWLDDHGIPYHNLHMRARGDFRRDDVVKQIILDFELLTSYDILFSVDDRKNVTDMWRKNGLTCLQCAVGDY